MAADEGVRKEKGNLECYAALRPTWKCFRKIAATKKTLVKFTIAPRLREIRRWPLLLVSLEEATSLRDRRSTPHPLSRRPRRHDPPPPPPAALEDDNLLRKILLLLPPQPSTLPRVSVVCKQWRHVATDPQFLRSFRASHREPPVLGLVMGYTRHPYFRSNLDPPDLIPHERFFPPDILHDLYMDLVGCRHGRVLFYERTQFEIFVWDPATGYRRWVAVPPEFDDKEIIVFNGAVLCASRAEGHVHGDCHSSPFQVVLIGIHEDNSRAFASVYSSETGMWGDLISTAAIRSMYDLTNPGTLVGDSLYWVFDGYEDGILKFDLDRQSLVNFEMPDLRYYSKSSFQIMPAEDRTDSIRLAIMAYNDFETWERKVGCDDADGWVLLKTVRLNTILGLGPMGGGRDNLILGYDEDDHVIYIRTDIGVCMFQLKSMQFRNLGKDNFTTTAYYPYRSFYTAVSDMAMCERRVGGTSAHLAKDGSSMNAASRGAGGVGDNATAASSGIVPQGGMFGTSKHRFQEMDANLVPSRVLTQTRIDVIFKKEMETRSKLSKAWAKWFRSNGIPGSKADCPHFCTAIKLTQQLGTRFDVPTGDEIDGTNLDADEEELP